MTPDRDQGSLGERLIKVWMARPDYVVGVPFRRMATDAEAEALAWMRGRMPTRRQLAKAVCLLDDASVENPKHDVETFHGHQADAILALLKLSLDSTRTVSG